MTTKVNGDKLILNALGSCVKSLASVTRQRDNLIVRAVERGIPQTTVAAAAGMSQAHVSRTLAAHRERAAERKAARAAKKSDASRTV